MKDFRMKEPLQIQKRSYFNPLLLLIPLLVFLVGILFSRMEDIPQAHRGMMFDRTGALVLGTGGYGLTGPVLSSGTYWVGLYDQIRMVECGMVTKPEKLTALTRDNIQFSLDLYVRYETNCNEDGAVTRILHQFTPDPGGIISTEQIYQNYIRPAIGESLRASVARYNANDLNPNREKLLKSIVENFRDKQTQWGSPLPILVGDITLSNMDFPDVLDKANENLAKQAILKNTAQAELATIEAQTTAAAARRALSMAEAQIETARIEEVGQALQKFPSYLQYQLQRDMPRIYEGAGQKGNLILTAPSPTILVQPKPQG